MQAVPLVDGHLITAPDLARLAGKSAKTVYAWTSRGVKLPDGTRFVLPVQGLDHRGNKLFDLVDAQRVVHAVTVRGTSRATTVAA
ncbi:hypothetical protein [Nocardiopsis rhodophaea]|uniref:hypothetical protein n=1 Tax=Nocardiopsis rhodophaea TaxID=280238 RepID=UPI0031D5E6D5